MIDDQVSAMAARWPSLALIEKDSRRAMWEGPLEPVQRRHRIRVDHTTPLLIERFSILKVQPRVQVLTPKLEHHPEFEDGPVPHVYNNPKDVSLPFLCLFDPYNGEWSLDDVLAETTIPWATRYLYFYEGWLATGKWLGGGRHPTAEELGDVDHKRLATV